MSAFTSYAWYAVQYREMRRVIELGASMTPQDQAVIARGIVVLTSGSLEGFMNGVGSEVTALCTGPWNELPDGVKRYMTLCAAAALSSRLSIADSIQMGDEATRVQFWDLVGHVTEWRGDPTKFRSSKFNTGLLGFYRDGAIGAIERYLKSLHPTGQSFTNWLKAKNYDLSRIETVLQQLMSARGAFAHGESRATTTLQDAKLYLVTATSIVRGVNAYLRPHFP